MRLKVLSCDVMFREICHLAARSRNLVDLEFVPKGLHDLKSRVMCERLQARVDAASTTEYDAVAMAYALCGNGLAGLQARSIPIVVPRAHDCISLFMGSRQTYQQYFESNPGVYFRTTGWIERAGPNNQLSGIGMAMDGLAVKYGEENAAYLREQLSQIEKTYRKFTYIGMGVGPDETCAEKTRADAAGRGWDFEKVEGDLSLLRRLMDGDWADADFLVVPPGHRIAPTYDDRIIEAREASDERA